MKASNLLADNVFSLKSPQAQLASSTTAGRPFYLLAPANIRPKKPDGPSIHWPFSKQKTYKPRSLIDQDSPLELISRSFVREVGLLHSITTTTETRVLETSHNESILVQDIIELQVTWHCVKNITLDIKFHILDYDDLDFDMLLPEERLKDVSQEINEDHKEVRRPGPKPHRTFSFKKEGGKLIDVYVKKFCSNAA
jgi:hypothetical protein